MAELAVIITLQRCYVCLITKWLYSGVHSKSTINVLYFLTSKAVNWIFLVLCEFVIIYLLIYLHMNCAFIIIVSFLISSCLISPILTIHIVLYLMVSFLLDCFMYCSMSDNILLKVNLVEIMLLFLFNIKYVTHQKDFSWLHWQLHFTIYIYTVYISRFLKDSLDQ